MRKTRVAIAAVLTAIVSTSVALAAESKVPEVKNLKASPVKFCREETKSCRHDGTHLRFTISTKAKVRIDVSEHRALNGPIVEFVGKLPKGKNDFYLHDKRMHTGWWTARVQGTNSVGSGGIDTIDIKVVKHD
jgi:hypothetical protein